MNGYNRVILMGTVGADAEVRALEGGNAVASMSIAVNESYTDQAGQRQTNVQWFRIEAWKGLANFLGNYGKKGTAFLIEGRLKTESYEKDGITMYSTKVVANNINFAGTKSTSNEPAQQQFQQPVQQQFQQPAQQPAQQQAVNQVNEYTSSESFTQGMNSGVADDLPF